MDLSGGAIKSTPDTKYDNVSVFINGKPFHIAGVINTSIPNIISNKLFEKLITE